MKRLCVAGLALALGLVASAGAQEMQWRPVASSPSSAPAASGVSLKAPVSSGNPAQTGLQPAAFNSVQGSTGQTTRAKMFEQPPQLMPVGPSLQESKQPPTGPELPQPKKLNDDGSTFWRWVTGMPPTVGPTYGQVIVGGDDGCCCEPMCCDECCGIRGWWRNHFGNRGWGDGCCMDACGFDGCCPPRPCFWMRGEYLLWSVKPLSSPALVTTNGAGLDPVLGLNGTVVAVGGERNQDINVRSGGRFTIGFDLPCLCNTGFETTYFFLADRTYNATFASNGFPRIGRPIQDVTPFSPVSKSAQAAELVAKSGVINNGSVSVDASNELWGVEANFRHQLCCDPCSRLDFLLGFRHVNLSESLVITEDLRSIQPPVLGSSAIFLTDRFYTRNEFYGGQIGLDYERRWNCWFVGATGKLALGSVHQTVMVNGSTTFRDGPLGGQSFPGGLLALPGTNIGHYSRDTFAIVPELGLKLGYHLTERLRLYVGYDILYMSTVVRPGDQISTVVNRSYQPLSTSSVPPGTGAALPTFDFRTTDFWAQGVSFGLEWRW